MPQRPTPLCVEMRYVMAAGRPTDYTPKIIKAAWDYAKGGWITAGDKVPSVAGLACEIGIHRETCHDWARDKDKEFSDILKAIAQKQERELLNNGLSGDFNYSITKMMLSKHGYSDATKQELSGPSGGAIPIEIKRTIIDPSEA
jgi:hypothetical protein